MKFNPDNIKKVSTVDGLLTEFNPFSYMEVFLEALTYELVEIESPDFQEISQRYLAYADTLFVQLESLLNSYGFKTSADFERIRHDIKAPLATIVSAMKVMSDPITDPAVTSQLVDILKTSLVRAKTELKILESYNPEDKAFDLNRFLSYIQKYQFTGLIDPKFNDTGKFELSVKVGESLSARPIIVTNLPVVILQQNILELLINAAKYGATEAKLDMHIIRDRLVIRVRDDGKGMSDERLIRTKNAIQTKNAASLGANPDSTNSTGRGLVAMSQGGFEINIHPATPDNGGTIVVAQLMLDMEATDALYPNKES